MGRSQDRLGRVRVLRCERPAPSTGLRVGSLTWRPLHARQHCAGMPFLQRQQVQRRGHQLAATEATRRARLPAAASRDRDRARTPLLRRRYPRPRDWRPSPHQPMTDVGPPASEGERSTHGERWHPRTTDPSTSDGPAGGSGGAITDHRDPWRSQAPASTCGSLSAFPARREPPRSRYRRRTKDRDGENGGGSR